MKFKIFGFLILAVITNSCANSNKSTTISDGLTQTCIDEKPQWVELAENQGVYRCVSDIKTRYTTTTIYVAPKPTATQELPSQNENAKILASGGCQDPTSGLVIKNGGLLNYPDGTRTCVNGRWSKPTKSGGSSGGGSSGGKTLVSQNCTISTTGLTSDWYGAQYSWTIWNNWSDGSRSVASMGSGYINQVPFGCY